jgi:hypothetical protein
MIDKANDAAATDAAEERRFLERLRPVIARSNDSERARGVLAALDERLSRLRRKTGGTRNGIRKVH